MKKEVTLLGAILVISQLITAQVSNQIQGVEIRNFEATQLNNGANMFVTPLATEVKVLSTEPESYQMKETIILPEIRPGETEGQYADKVQRIVEARISELKTQALFEFTDEKNAALIISPIYSIKTESSHNNVVNVIVKVKGYPAIYTKFRNITPADSVLMRISKTIPNNQGMTNPKFNTTIKTEEKQIVEEEVVIKKKERQK